LAPVAPDPKLSEAARRHARAMAASATFSHNGPDGNLTERMRRTNYAFATVVENIGAGAATPEEAAAIWEQSPPHARNLLNASVRNAGAGHARGPGEPFADYWCLILAEPAPP
ncbi:MAG: CAP domain-containing protein, partial [Alphaproteobacteria bacterium]